MNFSFAMLASKSLVLGFFEQDTLVLRENSMRQMTI
jgi:hypothetical protein